MTIEQIKDKLKSKEYDFLRTDKNLGNNIIILTLGGSHAYGMDKEGSDLDVRGIALNSKSDILLGTDFEQVVDVDTDTTMYSFNKMIQLFRTGGEIAVNSSAFPENRSALFCAVITGFVQLRRIAVNAAMPAGDETGCSF